MAAKDDEKHVVEPGNPKNLKNLKNLKNQGDIENKFTFIHLFCEAIERWSQNNKSKIIYTYTLFSRSFGSTFL